MRGKTFIELAGKKYHQVRTKMGRYGAIIEFQARDERGRWATGERVEIIAENVPFFQSKYDEIERGFSTESAIKWAKAHSYRGRKQSLDNTMSGIDKWIRRYTDVGGGITHEQAEDLLDRLSMLDYYDIQWLWDEYGFLFESSDYGMFVDSEKWNEQPDTDPLSEQKSRKVDRIVEGLEEALTQLGV